MDDQSQNQEDMSMDDILASIRRYVNNEPETPDVKKVATKTKAAAAKETISGEGPHSSVATAHIISNDSPIKKEKAVRNNKTSTAYTTNQKSSKHNDISPMKLTDDMAVNSVNKDDGHNSDAYHLNQNHEIKEAVNAVKSSANLRPNKPFSRLKDAINSAQQVHEKTEESVHQFLAKLVEPMIKNWLDLNIESLVEAKVDEAIKNLEKNSD